MTITPEHAADLEQLKRATLALKKLRAKVDALEGANTEPIAIVGIGCRFPGGANDPESFWRLLRDGVDAVVEVPADRWSADEYYDPDPDAPGKTWTKKAAFISGIDQFDPQFFGIAPREAASMDPQQRLILETAWEAMEDAGLVPAHLAGSQTGVFIGIGLNDYGRIQVPDQTLDPSLVNNYDLSGNALCITANRLSYLIDFRGPSMAIDTACSSSLVAVHVACRSLRNGESTLALAGGVNLMLTPHSAIGLTKFLAPDGHCKAFDARADGYARGEGAAIVVLKPLSKALADGDSIYAVIRGSAVNQDGFSSGLTVPNGVAQQAMLREALANAGVKPEQISYIEAHGTGTSLGDPIEANALGAVLGAGRPKDRPFTIGSVKTNIGHLEAGAGIAGLIKVALSLKHGQLPPSLHYESPNPNIPFEELNLRVQKTLTPWPDDAGQRIAGVSSFGFGGTNSHIILEEAPASAPLLESATVERPVHILTLSARNEAALKELAKRFANSPLEPLADACYTANVHRSHFAHRLTVVAESASDLREKLAAGVASGQVQRSARPKVVFLFTGQGAQYADMGRQLYETQPMFRKTLDECAEILRPYLGQSLISILYPAPGSPSLLNETAYTQPALFALEYALAELWKSWGIEPAAVIGHSVGEYVAACVAGVFSLEDGLKLIAERGRLMGALPAGGAMAAVFDDEARVARAIAAHAETVSIAAVNGPENIVVSGAEAAVQSVLEALKAEGIKSQRLTVSHAFHSPLMEPITAEFERAASLVKFNAPRIPLVSNLTGQLMESAPTADYWKRHLRQAVKFAQGIATLHAQGQALFLEIGPDPTLSGMGARCVPEGAAQWLPSLKRKQDNWTQLLRSLGALYVQGVAVDWNGFDQDYARRRVKLPTYPFQRARYWFTQTSRKPSRKAEPGLHPLLAQQLRSPAVTGFVFETQVSLADLPYLSDHRVFGSAVFPATAYLEMALAAANQAFGAGRHSLEEIVIQEAMLLSEEESKTLQLILTPEEDVAFQIFSQAGEAWQLHASGKIRRGQFAPEGASLDEARARCDQEISASAFYQTLSEMQFEYGSAFQGVERLWRGENEIVGQIRLPDSVSAAAYNIHPVLLDACIQVMGAALLEADSANIYLPLSLDSFRLYGRPAARLWSVVELQVNTIGQTASGDIRLFDETGQVVAEALGLRLKRASREALQRAGERNFDDWLYEVKWQLKPLEAQDKPVRAGKWLILADSNGVGAALTKRLQEQDESCVLVETPSSLDKLVSQENWRGIVHLWSLDAKSEIADQELVCGSALQLVQAIAKTQPSAPPRLWLVTRGAQAVNDEPVSVAGSPLWGFGGVVALEHPELRCVRVDLSPASDETESLLAELWSNEIENQIALRREGRYVARLRRAKSEHNRQPLQLQITNYGTLDGLTLQPTSRRAPGPGEIEIQVHATGLNFKEVLNVLGMIGEDVPLGNECAGVVVAVGEGVSRFNVGDEVIALAPHSFSTFAVADADLAVHKPAAMSFTEAATIPITFLTAYYGLHHLAKMKAGDKVLIHAAAGGVGLAAVQLAQRAGAEVFATVGSAEKRKYLESLGVKRIMNSRTLDFADEIMAITNGRGVDIVLNSLSGDFIVKSLASLAPNGRFLEIGKRGIWSREQMAQVRPDVSYAAFDLMDTIRADPAFIQTMFQDLLAAFADGSLKPLPRRAFPLGDAASAFRYMAQAKQIGKIVITQNQPVAIRADASYLITGGLGGLGLSVARWLATQGAKHLVLAGRRQPGEAASRVVSELQTMGIHVRVAQVDVARADQVEQLLANIEPTLKGIVHAAGTLDDGILQQQNWQKFTNATAPKIDGAWNLHTLTQHLPLDFFVMFSSAAALLGSPGQGNYAAGNAFMDALAHHRKAQGLPALSLNWGAWSEVGMAASLESQDQRRWAAQGMGAMTPEQGLAVFGQLLDATEAAQIGVLPLNWSTLAQRGNQSPLLSDLVAQAQARQAQPAKGRPEILSRLAETPPNKKLSVLAAHVREQAIRVLGLNPSQAIDPRQPLSEMGLDSLMAVELRNALGQSLGRSLPATLLFDYPTLETLAGYVFDDVLALKDGRAEEETEAKQEAAQHAAAVAELEQLSDEEAEALLLAELNKKG